MRATLLHWTCNSFRLNEKNAHSVYCFVLHAYMDEAVHLWCFPLMFKVVVTFCLKHLPYIVPLPFKFHLKPGFCVWIAE